MAISDQLITLSNTKTAIKDAIEAKGVTVPNGSAFASYATRISEITTEAGLPEPDNDTPETYTRPADWLTLPTVNTGDEKLVGLIAVYDHDSNFIALSAAGDYTVDWGDGSAPENVATGVTAQHIYSWSSISSGTLTSRGYRQAIITVTPQAGQQLTTINLNLRHSQSGLQTYTSPWLDIRMAGANVSTLTMGSASPTARLLLLEQFEYVGPSAITTMASKFQNCRRLYKIIGTAWTSLVTTFSGTFTSCAALIEVPDFNTSSCTNFTSAFTSCVRLRSLTLSTTAAVTTWTTCFNGCTNLRTVTIGSLAAATSIQQMFLNCTLLRSITLPNMPVCTNLSSAFSGCASLQEVTLGTTPAVTTVASMFTGCTSLRTIPLFSTGTCTAFNSMFQNCTSLQEVPLLDLSSATTVESMFGACTGLKTVPLFNTANCLTFTGMFTNCTSLTDVPLLDLNKATSTFGMFNNCSNLESVPAFNTANVTTFSAMFFGCVRLRTIPALDTSKGQSFDSMFSSCFSLETIPALNLSIATDVSSMFSNCNNLQYLPTMTINTGVTNIANMFNSCNSLASARLNGTSITISYANCKLSASALVDIFNGLATIGGRTITISGNWGASLLSASDRAIATGKGWTIVG